MIHVSDLFNAVNAVNLVSQVRVKSEVLDTGGWQVTIVDWQVWFWDSYDWNKEKQFVSIPIKLFDKLPALKPFRSTIEDAAEKKFSRSVGAAGDHRNGCTDVKIEGKTIVMPDGTHQAAEGLPDLQRRFVVFRCEQYGKDDRSDDTAAVSERTFPARSGEHGQDILYRA